MDSQICEKSNLRRTAYISNVPHSKSDSLMLNDFCLFPNSNSIFNTITSKI